MRRVFMFMLLLAGIAFMPSVTWSQFKQRPGGFGSFDPDESFNRLSGGKDVIVISELDQQKQFMVKMMAQRANITGDRITRDQYKSAMENVTNMFKKSSDGSAPKFGSPPGMITIPGTGTTGNTGIPSPMSGPGGSTSQTKEERKDRGNEADARSEEFFKRVDRDNDGLLKFEEMSETLQRERDTYDTNKDGFIDLAEYKAYISARFAKKDTPPSDKPANTEEKKPTENKAPVVTTESSQPYKEDPRPQIFRAGKLPTKELPDWFVRLDKEGDNDGQVGLYEWKTLNKTVEEFSAMDLNADGLLTAEEYLRWKASGKKVEGADQLAASETSNSSDRNRSGSQGGDGSRSFGRQGGDTGGSSRFGQMGQFGQFGSGFGPPMGGDNGGGNRFGPPMGVGGGNRFGPPMAGDSGGSNRFGPPKGGDNGGGGRFGPPKGGESSGNGQSNPFRKR